MIRTLGLEDLIYAAGLIDGEGYIGIKKDIGSMKRHHSRSPLYHERLQVKMKDHDALDLLSGLFGGTVRKEKRIYKSKLGFQPQSPMYVWCIMDRLAGNAIRSLMPFLRVKLREAQLVEKLWVSKRKPQSHGGRGVPMSPSVLAEREALWKEIRWMHGHPTEVIA